MSKSRNITVRVQSSEGTKRIELHPSDSIVKLFEKVHDAFGLPGFAFALFRERNNQGELVSSRSKSISSSGLRHGDMIYLAPLNGALLWENPRPSTSSSREGSYSLPQAADNRSSSSIARQSRQSTGSLVVEDEIDQVLWKQDGKVQRKRDEKLCRHGGNACCVHCSPLEPYDEVYLKDQNVKHMSFHAYLRKLSGGINKGKFVWLEEINCRIKPGCKDHPPWPKGICSKCQPNAITLNRQVYRHVDNAMFENPHLVERFLDYWRTTGHQRIGFLYGRYEVHSDVPLGIRATVAAIYEPPQESSRDHVTLLPDDKEQIVEEIASQLGLRRVGWIFTDLVAEDLKKGTVKHVRNVNSHFLSAQECIMAGHFQNLHPNPCRFSPNGCFGSKFVTICVTGDATNQVHMEGYSVSNQCMGLVRDQCLIPTKDAAELGYIKESSDKQYVPDVYYKEKDTYGNEVQRLARPLPVEYLLLDVPASTPLTPIYTFHFDSNIQPFPVENRLIDGHIQDFSQLSNYLQQFSPNQFLNAVSDFHLLLYIAVMDMLPMREHMKPLLTAVRERDNDKVIEWSQSEHWATVEQLIAASGTSGAVGSHHSAPTPPLDSNSPAAQWTCPHCTFLNLPHLHACDMCSLPR
ncbi:nuclear protein localization 4 isoform X1 [Lycorma delicatula]|uniref:nuclear protein localization 4 isoform X1 n=1 Tax=Lycorma delicatula TaxID=130591 RepID=UPI003F5151BF